MFTSLAIPSCKHVSTFIHKAGPPRFPVSFEHLWDYLKLLEFNSHGADARGHPGLTLFLWENGATFDDTMNKYTSADFPAGIDPRFPAILKSFGPFNRTVDTFNGTLPEGIDVTGRH